MSEVNGELVSHGCAIRYPKHSSFMNGYFEVRIRLFSNGDVDKLVSLCNQIIPLAISSLKFRLETENGTLIFSGHVQFRKDSC